MPRYLLVLAGLAVRVCLLKCSCLCVKCCPVNVQVSSYKATSITWRNQQSTDNNKQGASKQRASDFAHLHYSARLQAASRLPHPHTSLSFYCSPCCHGV
jgi:hypothetical protein